MTYHSTTEFVYFLLLLTLLLPEPKIKEVWLQLDFFNYSTNTQSTSIDCHFVRLALGALLSF